MEFKTEHNQISKGRIRHPGLIHVREPLFFPRNFVMVSQKTLTYNLAICIRTKTVCKPVFSSPEISDNLLSFGDKSHVCYTFPSPPSLPHIDVLFRRISTLINDSQSFLYFNPEVAFSSAYIGKILGNHSRSCKK
jgi:hypothetical protein